MTPRPIHRWKSLWLGILVLAFLGWSWVQSMNRLDTLRFGLGVDSWELLCTMGHISAIRYSDATTGRGLHSIRFESEPGGGSDPVSNPPFDIFGIEGIPHLKGWMVAHWFLILLFLIPWLALLAWRHQRMKRQAAGTPAPP